MKKILCLMLTVLMTLSLFVLPAYAEATLPAIAEGDAIYAGEQSITIRLAETQTATALTEEQAALVKITKLSDNTNIEFTSVVTGDILTLIPAESFVINPLNTPVDEKISYKLQLGNTTKLFTVDEFWVPNFVGDATNGEVSDLSIVKGNGIVIDVVDSDTIMLGTNAGAVYLDCEDVLTKENISLVTDVYYTGTSNRFSSIFAFNVAAEKGGILNTTNKVSAAGWMFATRPTPKYYHSQIVTIGNAASTATIASYGYNNPEEGGGRADILDENLNEAYTNINFGTDYSAAITVGSAGFDAEGSAGKFDDSTRYHYSIDKMGEIGTLVIANQLVSVLDTQAIYDSKNAGTAPKTGLMAISLYNNSYNCKTIFANIRLIHSTVADFEAVDLTVESVEVAGDEATITFAGSENIDLSAAVVENYIELSDGLTYDVVSKSGNTVVIKANNIEDYTKSYTLTVKEGFGYETALGIYKVSADIVETVQFVKLTVAVPERVYAGAQTITVKYENDITETYVVGDISLTKDGEAVEFTSEVNGDILTIMPTGGLVINAKNEPNPVTYELIIGGKTKIITVKELWTPSFVADTTNNKVSGLSLYQGSGLAVDVVNSDTIVVGSQGGAVYLDCEDLLTKENVSLVADVYYTGDSYRYSSVWGFNIPTKVAGILDTTNKYSGAGWRFQTRTGSYVRNYHSRTVVMANNGTNTASYGFNWKEPITEHKDILDENLKTPYNSTNFGTALASNANTIKVGTVALTEAFTNENKYHYAIDKMGEIATLTIGGVLVDVLDTQEYYDKHNSTAPKTGYFSLATYADLYNRKTVFSNIKLVTSEIDEFETGTIAQPVDIYANKNFMTVTFAEDVSKADTSKIVLTKGSVNVECAKEINGNKVVITPVDGFELAKAYNITIGTDFGWDAKFLAEEYNKDFRLNKVWEADLSSGSIKTGVILKGLSLKASKISDLTYAVQNNKVYVQDKLQSSLAIYGIVNNISDYSLTYTAEYYATQANSSTLFFNSTHANNAIEYAKASELLGWKTLKRNFALQEGSGHFNATWNNGVEIEKPFNIVSTNNDVTFTTEQITNEDETVTEIKKVTLPAGETAKPYNYTLDKLGTKGILYVNNEYVDTNDIADLYASAPSTGDIIIAGSGASAEAKNGGTIAFSNLLITTFELMSDRIVIENVTFLDNEGNPLESIKNATAVKGEATVKNLYNEAKPIKLIAIAYNADEEMIAVDFLDVQSPLGAKTNASAEYSFTGLSGLTEIKVVAWDSFTNLFPYCAPFTK